MWCDTVRWVYGLGVGKYICTTIIMCYSWKHKSAHNGIIGFYVSKQDDLEVWLDEDNSPEIDIKNGDGNVPKATVIEAYPDLRCWTQCSAVLPCYTSRHFC